MRTTLLALVFIVVSTFFFTLIDYQDIYFLNEGININYSTALLSSFSIFLGVLSKLVHNGILSSERIDNKNNLLFHIKNEITLHNFLRALIVAPLVLAIIYKDFTEYDDFLVFLVCFQNGFFFQSILNPKE